MNSGEALDDDGSSTQMSGLQRGMLSAGPLTVIVVSNHHPVHTVGLHTTGWRVLRQIYDLIKVLMGELL